MIMISKFFTRTQPRPVPAGPVSAGPVSAGPVSAGPVPAGPVSAVRRRRGLPAAAAVALLALIAAGCSSSGASSSSGSSTASAKTANVSSVVLHVGDQAGSGSQALLTAAGLISKLPFKIEWSDFTSGPPMLQAMGSGAVDIGSVGDAPPVFAAAGGEKVAIVGAVTAGPNASAIVVPANSPIHSVAQLKGKKIAVAQGSSADYHLLTVLNKAGLSVHDVSLDYLQPADGLAALTSGHVDAWDIWSPYIEQVVGQNHARILVNGTGYGAPYSFAVASRAALADPARAAAIRDYLKILNQAYVWGNSHVTTWASVWAKATGLPQSVMLKAAQDSAKTPVQITPAVVSAEQSVSNAFTTAGLIPGHVDFKNFSDSSFNDTVGGAS
jgi:sulfonate transport system substrate-binding protein